MDRRLLVRGLTYAIVLIALLIGQTWLSRSSVRMTNNIHAVYEAIATTVAFITGLIALIRFYSRPSYPYLFLATGFLGTAFLDGYHAIVTSPTFHMLFPSSLQALHPVSWNLSRIYLAVMLLLSWFTARPGFATKKVKEVPVYLISIAILGTTFFLIAYMSIPDLDIQIPLFGRPQDLLAGAIFFAALVGYLSRGAWQTETLDHWLVLSLILAFLSQVLCMSRSTGLFDTMFEQAHFLKVTSYLCVLVGLLFDVFRLYKFAEESQKELLIVMGRLEEANRANIRNVRKQKDVERRFLLAVQGAGEGIWEWDFSRDRIWCSSLFQQLLGYTGEERWTTVEKLRILLPDKDKKLWEQLREKLEKDLRFDIEIQLRHRDLGFRWFRIRGAAQRSSTGKLIRMVGSIQDVHELKQALNHVTLHAKMGMILAVKFSLGPMLKWCVEEMVKQLPIDLAKIWTLREGEQVLHLAATAGMKEPDRKRYARIKVGQWRVGAIAKEKEPHHSNDIAGQSTIDNIEWARKAKLTAFAGYPLMVGDRVVGVLAVFSKTHLDPHTLGTLESLSSGLGVGIERIRAEKRLNQSERRFRELAENMDGALWMHRYRDRKLVYVSPAWEKLTGQSVLELREDPEKWLERVHPEDRDRVAAAFHKNLKDGTYNERFRVQGGNGSIKWVWDRTFLIYKAHDHPSRIGRITQDVTEYMEAQRSLELIGEDLQRSNRELDEFAYDVSHDLKAPMRGIRKLCGWLIEDLGDNLPETPARYLRQLQDRVDRMERLLEDLLDLSRAGRMQDTVDEVDMERLILSVVDFLEPPPGFQIVLHPPLPIVVTQRPALEQVLRNLIGNAIKHHHKVNGTIEISVKRQEQQIEVTVQDDGPGIPEEDQEMVFRVFHRLHSRDKVEGSGMGLAIVKKLVESHGGTISLRSAPGTGATFRFTWCDLSSAGVSNGTPTDEDSVGGR